MQKVLRTLEQQGGPISSRGWYALGLEAGIAVVLFLGGVAVALSYSDKSDLSYIWAGPRSVLMGRDPYDPQQWSEILSSLGAQRPGFPPVYSYPPSVLVMLLPLGLMPLPALFVAWLVASLLVAAIACRALLQLTVPGARSVHFLVGLALVVSQPAVEGMLTGQWSFFLLAALAGTIVLQRRGHAAAAGLVGSVLLVKPQLMVVALPALIVACPGNSRTRYVGWLALLPAASVSGTALARPDQWVGWILNVPLVRITEPNLTTAWRVLSDSFGLAGTVAATMMAAIALVGVVRSRRDDDALLALALAVSLAFAPYMRAYDQLLTIVPILIAAKIAARHSSGTAALVGGAAIGAFVVSGWLVIQVLGQPRGSESLTWLVPLGALLVIVGTIQAMTGDPPTLTRALAPGSRLR